MAGARRSGRPRSRPYFSEVRSNVEETGDRGGDRVRCRSRGEKHEDRIYIRSKMKPSKKEAEANIPPEKEIVRPRNEIKLLDKDLMTVTTQLAKETVEVRNLKERADELRAKQSQDKELLNTRAEAIKKAADKTTDKQRDPTGRFGDRKAEHCGWTKAKLEKTGVEKLHEQSEDAEFNGCHHRRPRKDQGEPRKATGDAEEPEIDLASTVDGLEAELTNLKLRRWRASTKLKTAGSLKIKEDIRAFKTKMEIEREKLRLLPAALEPQLLHTPASLWMTSWPHSVSQQSQPPRAIREPLSSEFLVSQNRERPECLVSWEREGLETDSDRSRSRFVSKQVRLGFQSQNVRMMVCRGIVHSLTLPLRPPDWQRPPTMPRLSELADILIKCRVISRDQWDEAAQIGREDLSYSRSPHQKKDPSGGKVHHPHHLA